MEGTLFRKFVSENMGISFFYKSSLALSRSSDQSNGYDLNLNLKNEDLQINIVKLSPEANVGLRIFGLEKALEWSFDENEILIDKIKTNQYKISGEKNAAFAMTTNSTDIKKIKICRILVSHKGNGYLVSYQNAIDKFDMSDSQETFNTIIQTFKFLE